MKVLFAIAHLDKGGGQAVQALQLFRRLAPRVGGELLALSASDSSPRGTGTEGVTTVGRLRFPAGIWELSRAIRARLPDFDLVHALDQYYALPAARLARAHPLVVRLGAHPVEDFGSRYGWVGRTAMRLANPVLFSGTRVVVNARHLLAAFPKGRAVAIGNGVDVERFRSPPRREEARRELGLPADAVLVAYTGKIIPRKSVDDIYWLLGAIPTLHALLLGSDSEPYYGDRYHQSVRAQFPQVLPRVHHFPEVPMESVPRYLEAADLFVFPSRLEGMSNSLLEALAASLPVVAFDTPAQRDILPAEAGTLYADREGLRRAVQELIDDPGRRASMGRAARELATRSFSLEVATRAYIALYETVVR